MPRVDGGIVIHRPVDEVFRYATSAESHLRWVPGIRCAQYLDDGPLQVGSRWEAIVSFGGITVDSVMELTELDHGRRFAWRSVDSLVPSSGSYTFTALGPTATRFDYEFASGDRITAVLGAFALPVALRVLRREIRSRLERIKQTLEAGEPVVA
jgi:uncharacterized membrane protein